MKISEVHSSLVSTYDEWSSILVNKSFIRRRYAISWEDYRPTMLPEIVRKSDVENLQNTGQYSFQIIDDGSIIQLYYLYSSNGTKLIRAHLAYYNSIPNEDITDEESSLCKEGISSLSEINPQAEDLMSSFDDFPSGDPIVPWLRIDYDPEKERGPLHHSCHMHLGLLQHARIPCTRVPAPHQFIEFIIALFYPEHYAMRRLDETGSPSDLDRLCTANSSCFPVLEGYVYDILPHIQVPKRV